jgi:hypothetical protein
VVSGETSVASPVIWLASPVICLISAETTRGFAGDLADLRRDHAWLRR